MYRLGTGCFGLLTMLAVLWICGGTALWSYAGQQAATTQRPGSAQDRQINQMASGITLGLGAGTFACTGIPVALISGLFAILCFSGWQAERRHQEMITVEQSRNAVLAGMAMTQIAQAQMQYNQTQGNAGQNKPTLPSYFDEKNN